MSETLVNFLLETQSMSLAMPASPPSLPSYLPPARLLSSSPFPTSLPLTSDMGSHLGIPRSLESLANQMCFFLGRQNQFQVLLEQLQAHCLLAALCCNFPFVHL